LWKVARVQFDADDVFPPGPHTTHGRWVTDIIIGIISYILETPVKWARADDGRFGSSAHHQHHQQNCGEASSAKTAVCNIISKEADLNDQLPHNRRPPRDHGRR
jgi:hypothetical protein